MPRAIELLGGWLPHCMLLACTSSSSGSSDGGAPQAIAEASIARDAGDPCAGRGDELRGASLTGSNGLSLSLIAMQPDPPIVGDNSWEVRIELDGEPLAGAAEDILVLPTMPDHNHGSPVSVGVEEIDEGVYRFSPVNTFMPGYWEIEVEVDSTEVAGAVTLGVCVE